MAGSGNWQALRARPAPLHIRVALEPFSVFLSTAVAAQVHNGCFFENAAAADATWLIANPPYIPAVDDDILMPALHGGEDGATLTRVRCCLITLS